MQLTQNTYFGEGNRYYLEKLLGRGGFSEVWLAKDAITDLELVLKVYAPGTGMDEDGLQTFSKELARVYNLNHPNLLRPQHVDSWQGMPYLLMAYCAQGSLVKRIGRMTEPEIRKVLHDVASGLAYLHAHDVIHQDIKPDNILVDDAGNYVITDFGISTRARSTLRKSVGASAAHSGGTIAYMGPERFGKEPAPIKASDVWSLGAMLYELMTGDTPFGEHGGLIQKSGAEIPTIQGNYSDELKQMVEQMLALNPWDRPTAEDLAAGFVPSAPKGGRPTVPHPPSAPTPPTKPIPTPKRRKRIKLFIGLLAALLLLPCIIFAGMWLHKYHLIMDATAGHEYVDLGLPSGTKWATCNVGATVPEEYGHYYAWGETTTKSTYDWSTYKWCNGSYNTQTKYCTYSSWGTVDNKTVLDLTDDAARANWGGQWRMPTDAEWKELIDKCTWTWTTRNGVKGYEVKSNINGNSIFLPAAGYLNVYGLNDADDFGGYWSSSLYADRSQNAWFVRFSSDDVVRSRDGDRNRQFGLSVRPVLSDHAKEEQLRQEQLAQAQREAEERARIAEQEKKAALERAQQAEKQLKAEQERKAAEERARKAAAAKTGTHAGHEWVDLGLPSGTKWATCNVGATVPEEYGNYYAWGETAPKSTYNFSTYKWCNGTSDTQTKYCTNSNYGRVDNKTVLELADDAARANWGGAWRMPTDAEWTELRENCKWTWTTLNGVNGYEVKGTNGNSIFLPAAGYRSLVDLYYAGDFGFYWSSSLLTDYAWGVYFSSGNVGRDDSRRCYGWSVRPVCP